jgi:transcriptional regulator GlxA family with amidase domain
MKKTVTIFLYNDVEVLDFAGPLDVFLLANEHGQGELFDVQIVAKTKDPVIAAYNGLSINPQYEISEITRSDILVIPGGNDISDLLADVDTIQWVRDLADGADYVLSVCSGSLVLAKAGVLEGLKATTHHSDMLELTGLAPNTEIMDGVKFVDNGKVITSAGITTGIDMCLHALEKICGANIAKKTAISLEYK